MRRNLLPLLTSLCILPFGSVQAMTQCIFWGDFETKADTNMLTLNQPSKNQLTLSGQLLYRPLLKSEKHYWLGLQLVNPQIVLDKQQINPSLYGVPFAVKVSRQTKQVTDHHFAGKLKPEDKQKLIAIYQSLHIEHIYKRDLTTPTLLTESDNLGQYQVEYVEQETNKINRSKLKYLSTKPGAQLLDFSTPKVLADSFELKLDNCGLNALIGDNHTRVETKKGDISIEVKQRIQFNLNPAPVPSTALLLSLNENPKKWPQLSESILYPRPPAKPLKDAKAFIAALKSQDISQLSSEALAQLLYDNEQYLSALKEVIKSNVLSDKALGRLLLMIGKNDSPNAHQLLVDVYLDSEIQGKQRFRSLMGLKYAEQPLDPKLVDLVLESANQTSSGEQQRLSNSAMMVLGIIAKNQSGSEFSAYMGQRLVEQLKQTSQTSRQVSILAALGNSGNAEQQDQIAPFLNANEPKLRQQAADSLGKMPNETSLKYITEQLSVESDKDTKAALLKAMGNNELDNKQIDDLFSYSQSQPKEIRLASIQALAAQAKKDPDLKPRLKALIKREKDQQVLRALMRSVYSN
ncbi:HEAT repeat domain-containing protein [Pseudoalteromonas phenolica]|uniref:HEAT repeat domain-containing protein n=1 Tax=Pseudoalteromonas phenolica TaxID=161398 RepID=A0A0S2K780_9GAMM|nr:HEAT repeat domain-containing protein [Pseudoalteromonas phenolica]ALO44182.1 hypothetical protein PP2015_3710 [Pseudoalteromonas phenolica]MBE0357174.1 hypothetical protein [Pseudoalteromonas phenolica O-BC30]